MRKGLIFKITEFGFYLTKPAIKDPLHLPSSQWAPVHGHTFSGGGMNRKTEMVFRDRIRNKRGKLLGVR